MGNTQAASRKKKSRRRRKRRLTPTQGEEESWPNSDDSESKRDADGHESTGSEVKFKRPNDTKRHRTRAPQCGDGSGALRDPEQSTNSSSDSVSEDKSWTRPTQESDPFTSKSVSENYRLVVLTFSLCVYSTLLHVYVHVTCTKYNASFCM